MDVEKNIKTWLSWCLQQGLAFLDTSGQPLYIFVIRMSKCYVFIRDCYEEKEILWKIRDSNDWINFVLKLVEMSVKATVFKRWLFVLNAFALPALHVLVNMTQVGQPCLQSQSWSGGTSLCALRIRDLYGLTSVLVSSVVYQPFPISLYFLKWLGSCLRSHRCQNRAFLILHFPTVM